MRAYKIKHGYDVGEFLTAYRNLLQRAIDFIWENIQWAKKTFERHPEYLRDVEENLKRQYGGEELQRIMQTIRDLQTRERLIPRIPKTPEFQCNLRKTLRRDWDYCAHYIDSATRTAYRILKGWRRCYIKGMTNRNKPVIKRKFAKIKKTLYHIRKDGTLAIYIKPKQHLVFDLSKAWFKQRVEGWQLGELILKENELILTYKRPRKAETPSKMIAWDSNLMSLDGFSDDRGYVKIDLRPLYTLHITYENKRRSIQRLTEKKPRTARRLREKYSRRRNNRVRDFLHKLTTEKAREFRDYRHGFEDLDKQEMLKKRKDKERSKRLNREVSTMNWRQIRSLISYKATEVELIDPRGSSRTCPRCGGGMKRRKEWRVLSCGACGLVIERQLNAAINLYLRMKGFPPPEGWEEHVLPVLGRSGVAPMGAKADEVPR